MNKKSKGLHGFYRGIFIAALVCFGVSICVAVYNKSFTKNSQKVTAVISNIEERHTGTGSDKHIDHDVYVTYEYNGVEYENIKSDFYNGMMREGQKVEILCNKDNPIKIKSVSGSKFIVIVPAVMGTVLLIIVLIPFSINIKRKMRIKKLIQNGRAVYVTVDAIEQNMNYRVNGINPYNIMCSYYDAGTGTTRRFKSHNIWTDVSQKIYVGNTIRVYIDLANENNYYVEYK